jgi:arylsulfatase
MIEFLEEDRGDSRPFVAYLAHQAPHDPLQVPKPWLRRYTGRYDFGWDFARQTRMARMIEMGIMPEGTTIAPRLWFVPEFADLLAAPQVVQARRMEIYASMVEYIDEQVGVLVEYLEESGQLDNTIILFFSDNGPEGNDPIPQALQRPNLRSSAFYANNYDTQFEAWGRESGYVAYGAPWAQVSATPFREYKGAMSEGGIRSPLIVWQPNSPNASTINTQAVLSVMDVAPTMMEFAGIDAPNMQGKSWASMLQGLEDSPRDDDDIIAMEFQNARMIRRGTWKALFMPEPFGTGDWQLFDIVNDSAEQDDLSADYPEIKDELVLAWEVYARENNFILPNRTFYDGMSDILPPKPPVPSGSYPRGQEPNFTGSNDE